MRPFSTYEEVPVKFTAALHNYINFNNRAVLRVNTEIGYQLGLVTKSKNNMGFLWLRTISTRSLSKPNVAIRVHFPAHYFVLPGLRNFNRRRMASTRYSAIVNIKRCWSHEPLSILTSGHNKSVLATLTHNVPGNHALKYGHWHSTAEHDRVVKTFVIKPGTECRFRSIA